MDDDLAAMSRGRLVEEAVRRRAGIRAHPAATGHDLCRHHPALRALLPERTGPEVAEPRWPRFLRHRESLDRQRPDAPVHDAECSG